MKFDVIIGNPPYQLSIGLEGANSSSAQAIYHSFIDQSMKVSPKNLSMITPSKWMTRAARGINDDWITSMIDSKQFREFHDFEDSGDCFPSVDIKGGVSYFLWDRNYEGKCRYCFYKSGEEQPLSVEATLNEKGANIVIRNPETLSILNKIESVEKGYYLNPANNFSGLVSPKHFYDDGYTLTSNWTGYKDAPTAEFCIKYYLNIKNKRAVRWISEKQIPKHKNTIYHNRVYIPAAGGSGFDDIILGRPILGESKSVCSQTFLIIGFDPDKHNFSTEQCKNIIRYINTKFFRYLVSIKKKTQSAPRGVYQFVPLQDFSKNITDEYLYGKYNLSKEEIDLIENSVRSIGMEEAE